MTKRKPEREAKPKQGRMVIAKFVVRGGGDIEDYRRQIGSGAAAFYDEEALDERE